MLDMVSGGIPDPVSATSMASRSASPAVLILIVPPAHRRGDGSLVMKSSNAIDALGEAGGTIKISTAGDADRLAIEVADTGSGIPPETMSASSILSLAQGAGKGYGLGLAICSTLGRVF